MKKKKRINFPINPNLGGLLGFVLWWGEGGGAIGVGG